MTAYCQLKKEKSKTRLTIENHTDYVNESLIIIKAKARIINNSSK